MTISARTRSIVVMTFVLCGISASTSWAQRVYMEAQPGPGIDLTNPKRPVVEPGRTLTVFVKVDGSKEPCMGLVAYDIQIDVSSLGFAIGDLTPGCWVSNCHEDWPYRRIPNLAGCLMAQHGGATTRPAHSPNITTDGAYLVEFTFETTPDTAGEWLVTYANMKVNAMLRCTESGNIDISTNPSNYEDITVLVGEKPTRLEVTPEMLSMCVQALTIGTSW
jgi:hypothetical protein